MHDLERLLRLVDRVGEPVPPQVWEAPELTRYAVTGRYSGYVPPLTANDRTRAVAIAEAVVAWAAERVAIEAPGEVTG